MSYKQLMQAIKAKDMPLNKGSWGKKKEVLVCALVNQSSSTLHRT